MTIYRFLRAAASVLLALTMNSCIFPFDTDFEGQTGEYPLVVEGDIMIGGTTTVSLDVGVQDPQMVIHLMMGNYGTRALRLVPVDNARLMDMDNFAGASVGMSCAGRENLEIDCELGDHYVTLVPTKAMTEQADEWLCQLNLYDSQQQVLSSAPFKIIVQLRDIWII